MLTPDVITAAAPDASSLKAGRELGTPRKWQTLGGDNEVLWGLAMGSGKEPYQTRVSLADLSSKCSCPSRKFPCKHALGLMFIAVGQPSALTESERPPWVVEWIEARAMRADKAAQQTEKKASKPVDAKAAEKRQAKREERIADGVGLLRQSLFDFCREGLASPTVRNPATWEDLARRMIDCQAPGLAANLRYISETVIPSDNSDQLLPYELGRLYLLLHCIETAAPDDEAMASELRNQIGARNDPSDTRGPAIDDDWFVATRSFSERDRLVTSVTWLFGTNSRQWAKVLRFAHVPATIVEPWPLGAMVQVSLAMEKGLLPQRAHPSDIGTTRLTHLPQAAETSIDALLDRFASSLAVNPFLRSVPFLMNLQPNDSLEFLVDKGGTCLPWKPTGEVAIMADAICGGRTTLMCGEWDGHALKVLAIADGHAWIPLVSQKT